MLGTPQFRFTLYHSVLYPGGTVIPIPIGWKASKVRLERHKKFHSLVEFFEGSFIFYGSARTILKQIEDNYGVNSYVGITIELMYNSAWSTLFSGQIDLSALEDISKASTFYKFKAPIIRNDFWSKFINRLDSQVDLQATVDLDGAVRTAVNKITLPLPSQILRTDYYGFHSDDVSYNLPAGDYGGIDLKLINRDEVKTRTPILREVTVDLPGSLFKVEQAGEYFIDAEFFITDVLSGSGAGTGYITTVNAFIKINNAAATAFTKTNYGVDGVNGYTGLTYTDTITLSPGDEIRIYFESTGTTAFIWLDFYFSYLNIICSSIVEESSTDAYLLKDAAESIISKIVGYDAVVTSAYLDTDIGLAAIMKGKHLRGIPFATKKLTMSFNQWWNGADPLLNLGLGYIDGSNELEIEDKAAFYDSTPIINFGNVPNLVRRNDLDKWFKQVVTGFIKWSLESNNGIDDTQTKSSYNTLFASFGKEISIISEFYCAALGIEQTRRNRVELGKDGKIDEEIVLISVKDDGGGGYTPEVGTDFDSVTGMDNPDTRYNIRHTPATILKRWQNYLQGCLQNAYYLENFKFASGEGNYEQEVTFGAGDREFPEQVISGDEDVPSDINFLFIPQAFECTIPMSYAQYLTIKANRKKALGISQTLTKYKAMHILELDYTMMEGSATLVLLYGYNPAVITADLTDTMETVAGTIENNNDVFEITADIDDTMETVDGDVVSSQFDDFGSGGSEAAACNIDLVLYWPSSVAFGPGVTMYTDAALTTPLAGETYIVQNGVGEIFNISSGGVVGASTGNFC